MTLEVAAGLLQAALWRPESAYKSAHKLVQYHLARNRQARRSRRMTRLAKRLRTLPQK